MINIKNIIDKIYDKIFNLILYKELKNRLSQLDFLNKRYRNINIENNIDNQPTLDNNILVELFVYDRIIIKDNTCDKCNKYFGNNYKNISIKKDDMNEDITIVECKSCGNIMLFRNWE